MSTLVVPVEQTRTDGMLGASDAAAALGLDRYTSPLTVWKRLRGLPVEEERSPALDEAAAWGQLIEPVVRGKYAIDRNRLVLVPRSSFVKDGWLRCTPDGLSLPNIPIGASMNPPAPRTYVTEMPIDLAMRDPEWKENDAGLLQVKNRHAFARDDWRDGVPAKEQVQCRVEMAVCDLPWNDCAVLLGGNRMLVHRVERDLELEERILTDLRAFWELVQAGKEPSPDASAAWREYASSKMRPTKVMITPDEEMRELVDYWLSQRRKRKQIEEEEEAAKTDIMLRLSAAGATGIDLGERGKVTAYKTGSRTDWKAWAQSLNPNPPPQKYVKESKTWAIRFNGDDDE